MVYKKYSILFQGKFNDTSKVKEFLESENVKIEKWGQDYVRFKNFDGVYKILQMSAHEDITFSHRFFTPWNTDFNKYLSQILNKIDQCLIDDCIRKVMEHLTWTELIHLAGFSERYYSLVEENFRSRFKTFQLTSTTFGMRIGVINLHYFLHLFGKSLTHFSFSLQSIKDYSFGLNVYGSFEKYMIICTIVNLTSTNLRTLDLDSFHLTDQEKGLTKSLFQMLEARNVEVNYN